QPVDPRALRRTADERRASRVETHPIPLLDDASTLGRSSPSWEVAVAQFVVSQDPVRKLARNRRFAAALVRLAWPELLNTGCVTTKARRDPGDIFLDEWDEHYRRHLIAWADGNVAQIQSLLEGLATELAELAGELTGGSGGRPHSG